MDHKYQRPTAQVLWLHCKLCFSKTWISIDGTIIMCSWVWCTNSVEVATQQVCCCGWLIGEFLTQYSASASFCNYVWGDQEAREMQSAGAGHNHIKEEESGDEPLWSCQNWNNDSRNLHQGKKWNLVCRQASRQEYTLHMLVQQAQSTTPWEKG